MTVSNSNDDSTIGLSRQDAELVANALNEVLNGISVVDFSVRVGQQDVVDDLQRQISRLLGADPSMHLEFVLNDAQLLVLRRSLDLVVADIEDAEFETRLGGTKVDASKLAARLGSNSS